MSLLSSYSTGNQVDQTALCVRYAVNYTGSLYVVTRTATRNYAYIGMTKAAAQSCADAKLAQYSRTYYSVDYSDSEPTVKSRTATMASVSYATDGNSSWRCSIAVDETDTRASSSAPKDLDDLFRIENARNYDDRFSAYSLTCSRTGTNTGSVSSTIPDFHPQQCSIQAKQTAQASWTGLAVTWDGSAFTYSGEYAFLRAIYGYYDSNTV